MSEVKRKAVANRIKAAVSVFNVSMREAAMEVKGLELDIDLESYCDWCDFASELLGDPDIDFVSVNAISYQPPEPPRKTY